MKNLSGKRGIALVVCTVLTIATLALGCHMDKKNRQAKQQEITYSDSYYGKFTMDDINILQRWVLDHEDYEFRESNDYKTNPLALTDDWGHMLQFNSKEECYSYALQKLNTTVTEGQMAEVSDDHKDDKLIWIMGEALGRDISVDKSNDLHSSIDTFWNGYGDTWGE